MANTNTAEVMQAEPWYFKDPNNPTLPELVRLMEKLDDGLIEFDPELHAEMVGAAQVKVDNYKRYFDQIDAEDARMADEIKERQEYRKRLANNKKKLEELLLFYHEKGQLLPGHQYEFKVRKSSRTVVKTQPNEDLYFAFPELIRTKMEWKLTEVKERLKADPNSELAEFLDITESKSVGFKLRKGVDL